MHLGLEQAAHPEVNIGWVAVQLLQASQLLRVLRWYIVKKMIDCFAVEIF